MAAKLGAEMTGPHQTPITTAALQGYRLAVLRAPLKEITADERAALVGFVRQGGSLLLVVDEERRDVALDHARQRPDHSPSAWH